MASIRQTNLKPVVEWQHLREQALQVQGGSAVVDFPRLDGPSDADSLSIAVHEQGRKDGVRTASDELRDCARVR